MTDGALVLMSIASIVTAAGVVVLHYLAERRRSTEFAAVAGALAERSKAIGELAETLSERSSLRRALLVPERRGAKSQPLSDVVLLRMVHQAARAGLAADEGHGWPVGERSLHGADFPTRWASEMDLEFAQFAPMHWKLCGNEIRPVQEKQEMWYVRYPHHVSKEPA